MRPVLLVRHSDDWVADRVRRWQPPVWVELWMLASTRLGDGWAWLAVVLAAAAEGGAASRTLAEAVAAIVVVNAVQVAAKHAFRRSRPAAASRRRVAAPDRFSFPSGHAMNAFAAAVLVTTHVPSAGALAFAAAASVGASRVALQLHYVSDVVAGAALAVVVVVLLRG